jgi:BirA family biotin operon repressor/biotin-[acetyl-CoA-carboxylase] ligase
MVIGQPVLPAGFTLLSFSDIDSTNDEAKRQAELGAATGTLIWARQQSSGRGRRGRSFISPPGNCYSSLILRPRVAPRAAAQLSFVAAIAVAEAVAAQLPVGPHITCKWPNDVLIDGAKCSGILLESRIDGAALEWLIIGTGINVASHPEGLESPATSLQAAGGLVTVETMLEAYAERLAHWLERWLREGFPPIRQAWLLRADGLGQAVRVRLADATLHGVFESLDEQGALVLLYADGSRRCITAGEVFRPA